MVSLSLCNFLLCLSQLKAELLRKTQIGMQPSNEPSAGVENVMLSSPFIRWDTFICPIDESMLIFCQVIWFGTGDMGKQTLFFLFSQLLWTKELDCNSLCELSFELS